MPYANPEAQKEYQRDWSKKKNSDVRNRTEKISSSVITWEQLQDIKVVDKLASWKDCVSMGKECVAHHKINRMEIAAIALRACIIKRGGQPTEEERKKTLRNFANEIGVHPSTLWTWVKLKTHLLDKLPAHLLQSGFDFGAAHAAMRSGGKGTYLDKYEQYYGNKDIRLAYQSLRYASTLAHTLEAHGTSLFNKEEKEKLYQHIKFSWDYVKSDV